MPGTITENSNSLASGTLGSFVSPIGTYSSGAAIVGPNEFGGANDSNYIAVDARSATTSYTLTFNGPQFLYSGSTSTGFESDNHTILAATPEASGYAFLLSARVLAGFLVRRVGQRH
jgi:hypothetical protein